MHGSGGMRVCGRIGGGASFRYPPEWDMVLGERR